MATYGLNCLAHMTIGPVPNQWIQHQQLFDPDAPGLPMFYMHLPPDRQRDRLYGCAISIAPGKPAGEDMREFEIALDSTV